MIFHTAIVPRLATSTPELTLEGGRPRPPLTLEGGRPRPPRAQAHRGRLRAVVLALTMALSAATTHAQGSLSPTSAPAASMHSLDEIFAASTSSSTPIRHADLPLTITTPGTYRFVEAIESTNWNQTAITVATNGVRIDMFGFSLWGPGKTNGVSGHGIYSPDHGVTVFNGYVTHWREDGLHLGHGSKVRCIRSRHNGDDGIDVSGAGVITECNAASNLGSGFRLGDGTTIFHCTSRFNDGSGVAAGVACSMTQVAVDNNGVSSTDHGISTGYGSVVDGSLSRFNAGDGIRAGAGTTIRSSNFDDNDYSGINAGDGCLIEHNVCNDNGGTGTGGSGIRVSSQCRVRANVVISSLNGAAIHATGSRNVIQRNVVNQNLVGIRTDSTTNYSEQNTLASNTSSNLNLKGSTEGSGDYGNVEY